MQSRMNRDFISINILATTTKGPALLLVGPAVNQKEDYTRLLQI